MMSRLGVLVGTTVAVAATALMLPARGQERRNSTADPSRSTTRQVTFTHDVAPIIFHSCASCHHPGEAAPFSLLTYKDVKEHARQIVAVTRMRFMPPWLPEPQPLKFAGELRLSEQELSTLQQWVEQGSSEGTPGDLPLVPKFTEEWQLGKPDLILTADKPFTLPAKGTDVYWNFIIRVPINRTRWVKAIEIRPGDKRLVHHANMLVDRLESCRAREKEPGAGFPGMDMRIESEVFDPDSHFLFWKPGTVPHVEPPDMALRLDKGTDLVLNTHLQPSGKTETIQPSIGIYFTDVPATLHPMLLQLENDAALDIPAGQKNFVVGDDFSLPIDVDVLAIYPHAHYLGKDILAFATLPDGEREILIHIKRWDLNWQAVYRYEKPIALPKGSTISMRYTYDNSPGNFANPNHPPKRVTAGNRSSDEMAHLWLQVLPRNYQPASGDPRMVLQEALARHHVERDPGDFEAHYNLAAMLQRRGELEGATAQYEAALKIHPQDATANNALGTALLAGGHPDRAIPHFLAALRARPDYFDAHYNLGNTLAMRGNFSGAADQFRAAVQLNPDDADAEANLGGALAELGRISEAKMHLQRALQINPSHALARENLEQLNQ